MIAAPATLGLLGGGQLGRYFVLAAQQLGYRVVVVDPQPDCPAASVADVHLVAAYDDPAALVRLVAECAAVTTEFENVPADALRWLAAHRPVRPSAEAVGVCQNRLVEKRFLVEHGFPLAPFAAIARAADLEAAGDELFPGILKVIRHGYDGKGQVRVATRAEALTAFAELGGEACVLEALLPLEGEVSVVLARGADGEVQAYTPSENEHRHGILDVSIVPARLPAERLAEAQAIARAIAEKLDYVGTLAVEFFLVGGALKVNELAPRPHNSGHWTLDACTVSQFEQQVRALCGLPLGNPEAKQAAVMVNLLGDLWFDAQGAAREPDWAAIAAPDLTLHLYGKSDARPGRKMGHYTVLGDAVAPLRELAEACRAALAPESAAPAEQVQRAA